MIKEKIANKSKLTVTEVRNRKAELLRCGSIPEFVKIKEMYQVFQLFTEVNMKNKLLVQQ